MSYPPSLTISPLADTTRKYVTLRTLAYTTHKSLVGWSEIFKRTPQVPPQIVVAHQVVAPYITLRLIVLGR